MSLKQCQHLFCQAVCQHVTKREMMCSAKEPFGTGSAQSNFVQVMANGTCNWWPRFEMSASNCPMNIAWFPFDEQNCDLIYESWRYPSNELNFTAPSVSVLLSHYNSSAEWDLIGKSSKSDTWSFHAIHALIKLSSIYDDLFSLVICPTFNDLSSSLLTVTWMS